MVAQVGLSLVLLIGAGLAVRSLQVALATDPGFNDTGVLLADIDLSLQGYDETRALGVYARIIDRLANLPGVDVASVAAVVPVNPNGSRRTVEVEGYVPRPQEDMELNYNRVGPGYFQAMGIAVVQGRVFSDVGVDGGRGEVVVNETFAERYWPGQDPLGRVIGARGGSGDDTRVVGVVQDGKYRSMREDPLPYLYFPIAQSFSPRVTLVTRVDGDPMAMLPALRRAIQAIEPTLPIYAERTLETQRARAGVGERGGATLLAAAEWGSPGPRGAVAWGSGRSPV